MEQKIRSEIFLLIQPVGIDVLKTLQKVYLSSLWCPVGPEKNTFRQNSLSIQIDWYQHAHYRVPGFLPTLPSRPNWVTPPPHPYTSVGPPAPWIREGRNYLCLAIFSIFCLICFLDKVRKNVFHNQPALSRRPPFPVLDRGEAWRMDCGTPVRYLYKYL